VTNPVLAVRATSKGPEGARVPIGRGCWTWCPACQLAHRFEILGEDGSHPDRPQGDYWTWDGNLKAPTFSPSMLVRWTAAATDTEPAVEHRCHSFLRAGRWEFLADCTHALAGQTVDMVPLPDWLCRG
jgi:hypothetical protein